jgi:broad specificity phosphatase PhoE
VGASRVVLWRHGRTTYNATGVFQGQLDIPLDEVGVAQAARAAAVLADLPPARIVSSDLQRAADTAGALAAVTGIEVELDEALREVHAGQWQDKRHAEIEAGWPEQYRAWRGGEDVAIGGGERRSDVGVRVAAAVERHAAATEDGGTLVVTSHGGATRAGVLALLGLPITAWPRLGGLGNCRWAVLTPRSDGWALTGHDLGPAGDLDPAPTTAEFAIL